MDKLLYGVAYYDEYMPYDRLAEDVKMMKAANINVVRIASSSPGYPGVPLPSRSGSHRSVCRQ